MANEVRLHRVQDYSAGVREAALNSLLALAWLVECKWTFAQQTLALLRALSAQSATNSAARPVNVIGFIRYFCAVFLSYARVQMPEREQKKRPSVRTCIACITTCFKFLS